MLIITGLLALETKDDSLFRTVINKIESIESEHESSDEAQHFLNKIYKIVGKGKESKTLKQAIGIKRELTDSDLFQQILLDKYSKCKWKQFVKKNCEFELCLPPLNPSLYSLAQIEKTSDFERFKEFLQTKIANIPISLSEYYFVRLQASILMRYHNCFIVITI